MTSPPIIDTDVLVVGYGPVGAALAAMLGRYGIGTLVVEKAPDILMAPRAMSLDNEALRILQMVGLQEDTFDKVAIPNVRMHCPYVGEFGKVNTGGSIDGHPKLVTFYQPDLEQALRRQVAAHDSVTTLTGVEMTGFEQDGNGVQASLAWKDGTRKLVRSHYLVAADGAGSSVRKAIGQNFEGTTYTEDWLIVDARSVPGNFDHLEFLCDPDRPTVHVVGPGGRIRWEFMLRPGEAREEMEKDETIAKLLAPWTKVGDADIERKAVYRFHARSCERYSLGRVFLVGDAAHITPPFVGQGLVAGLRDVANLSWKLAWVLRKQAAAAILDSYDQERRPHATKMIALARFMGHMVMPRNAVMAALLHGMTALLRRIPFLRGFFDELGIKPENRFKQGLFSKGRGKLRRGGCIPQAVVRDGQGRHLLSDDALGAHLTLVGFGLDPAKHLSADAREDWESRGGRIRQFYLRGEALHRGESAFEDLSGALVPGTVPYGWAAIVRPDRTIITDGPGTETARLVTETLKLLGPSTRSA